MFRSRVVSVVLRTLVNSNYRVDHSLLVNSTIIRPPSTSVVRNFGVSQCLWAKKQKEQGGTEKKRDHGGSKKKNDDYERLKFLEKFQNNLGLILGCDEKTARKIARKCPDVLTVPVHELTLRRDYLRDQGVRLEYIHEMPWLLTQDTDFFESKLEEVVSILGVEPDCALPFTKLKTRQLESIRETWMRETNFHAVLRQGIMKNRMEVLQAEMAIERGDVIRMFARELRVAVWNLEKMIKMLKLLKAEAGVKMVDVTKHPVVLGVKIETAKSRISMIKPHQLGEIRPWMLHDSRNKLETYIRRYTMEREALAGHPDRISLLQELLQCTPEELEGITTTYKLVLKHSSAELASKIRFLQGMGYTTQEIKQNIRVLLCSKNTLKVRYNELSRYKSCSPKLWQLRLNNTDYKRLLQRLDAAEKDSKEESAEDTNEMLHRILKNYCVN